MTLPLEGVRVIEVGQALAGPLAGAVLADMGAEVIKIEKPDGGDDARLWGPPFGPDGETSLYFHSQNRNKRSVVLDLKSPADVEALHRLCETADILIQNLRPGVVDEIGIGPEAMLERHPRLVYCSIWAFGYQGPMRLNPGFDPLLQAYGGMMSMTGRPEDPPTFCGASINDKATGLFCTIGALAALRQRDRTGRGCLVDTSLFETAVFWVEGQVNQHLATGDVPRRHGTGAAVIVPYQVFETADRPFCLAAGNDRLWARCAKVLGHADWATDPRFARGRDRVKHRAILVPMIAEVLRTNTRAHWIAALEAAGVPCAAVNDIGEVAATEQFAAVDIVQTLPESGVRVVGLPMSFDRKRPWSDRPAPTLGQHTGEYLKR
ncbi:CaiB/BaiF CoA transferase family protein [Paracraurococcus ruber]|uniref:Carnitine dehydratase n=1 Tax=Paracraurococcus ruber TaxID=77675 RepID=A0ABS1CWS8_9PROT|nr:CoA transferase [Paracraurococcus ruber]MBK1658917.1 carnitine dehydratase [Paracraurococcus ruber]TDG30842.1 CoA transferase [Paracraurococcus ruber]